MEFYSVVKKNEILSFAGKWMELENIILSKGSQTQKTTTETSSSGAFFFNKQNSCYRNFSCDRLENLNRLDLKIGPHNFLMRHLFYFLENVLLNLKFLNLSYWFVIYALKNFLGQFIWLFLIVLN
jgi:hypothetical protein